MMSSEAKRPRLEEDIAVTTFRRYLRINTSQPNPDYGMVPVELVSILCCWHSCSFWSNIPTRIGARSWTGVWRRGGECSLDYITWHAGVVLNSSHWNTLVLICWTTLFWGGAQEDEEGWPDSSYILLAFCEHCYTQKEQPVSTTSPCIYLQYFKCKTNVTNADETFLHGASTVLA